MNTAVQYEERLAQAKEALKAGKVTDAIQTLEQAKEVDGRSTQAYEMLGMVYFRTGKYDEAIKNYERITQLAPRDAAALINLGAVYNRMGEHNKAVTVLRKGVQMDRKSAVGYYNLGVAHKKMNQLGLAVPAYREAIRIDPNLAEAYQNLGNVYLEMKNYQQAKIHFNKALEINPNLAKAKKGLENLEEAKDASRKTASPFGRLVETAGLEARQNKIRNFKTLSDHERIVDRHNVRNQLKELQAAIQEVLEYTTRQLIPSIQLVDREAVQDSSNLPAIQEVGNKFRSTFKQLGAMRDMLNGAIQKLEAHQESMTVR
ncbi:MAG: tetratricopeptide repeat protein [Planctomycetales bacterium]